MFGGLGVGELLLIMLVALVVFGPRRLPEIGRTIGKALAEFRKATDELKNTIEREVRVDEFRQITPTSIVPPLQAVSRIEPSALPAGEPIDVTPVETSEPAPSAARSEGHDGLHETVASLDPGQSQGAAASQEDPGSHEPAGITKVTTPESTSRQAE